MMTIHLKFLALALCIILCVGEGHYVAPEKEDLDAAVVEEIKEGLLATETSLQEEPRDISGNYTLLLPQDLKGEEMTKSKDVSGKTVDGDGFSLRIVSRKEWNATVTKTEFENRPHPAKYVIITTEGKRCFEPTKCAARVREAQVDTAEEDRDELSSFYIGEDSYVYEGLGWYLDDTWKKEGIERLSLWITFLGEFMDQLPSPIAIEAYKALIKHAISSGNLLSDYEIVSMRIFDDNSTYLGDKIEEEIKNWEYYTDQVDLYSGTDYDTAGRFPIVFREEWDVEGTNTTYEALSLPVEYVVVANYMERCWFTEDCVALMQRERETAVENAGDVFFNFYIADDGFAYNGRGWDVAPYSTIQEIRNRYMIVAFFGNFQSYPPSKRAFLAFSKLLNLGVWLGKVSPSYKILPCRIFYSDDFLIGERLEQELKKLDRFSDNI